MIKTFVLNESSFSEEELKSFLAGYSVGIELSLSNMAFVTFDKQDEFLQAKTKLSATPLNGEIPSIIVIPPLENKGSVGTKECPICVTQRLENEFFFCNAVEKNFETGHKVCRDCLLAAVCSGTTKKSMKFNCLINNCNGFYDSEDLVKAVGDEGYAHVAQLQQRAEDAVQKRLLLAAQEKERVAMAIEQGTYTPEHFRSYLLDVVANVKNATCPGCLTSEEKDENCNNEECERCNIHFCYVCDKLLPGAGHFPDHFGIGPGLCPLYLQGEARARWPKEKGRRIGEAFLQAHPALGSRSEFVQVLKDVVG